MRPRLLPLVYRSTLTACPLAVIWTLSVMMDTSAQLSVPGPGRGQPSQLFWCHSVALSESPGAPKGV